MTCSGDVLVTLLLLGVGLLAATVHLQNKGHQLSNSIVAPPMIGMASQQGPWPKCLGLSVESCESYILSVTARESLDLQIISPGTALSGNFQKNRIRIFVDEEGVVSAVPGRG